MTITIQLAPAEEAELIRKAEREGQDAETTARQMLVQALVSEAQEQAETLEGVRRGLEASDTGRVRSFADLAVELRRKYNLPTHLSNEEINAMPKTS